MTTAIPECAALLRWLQNELDVVETYKVALERIVDVGEREVAREVMQSHVEHADELRDLLRALGKDPREAPAHSCTRERLAMLKTKGSNALDALLASERARLIAYEDALTHPHIKPLIAQLVERSVANERIHLRKLAEGRVGRAA